LVTAALTILRGYCAAGRPDQRLPAWGSFEAWSDLVRSTIVWAGLPDPGATRQELASTADTEAELLRLLIAGWKEIDPGGYGTTVSAALKRLDDDQANTQFPTFREAIAQLSAKGKPSARSIGMKIHHVRGRIVGGESFDKLEKKEGSWWFVKQVSAGDYRD
jgi:putative DNA primase/helicase